MKYISGRPLYDADLIFVIQEMKKLSSSFHLLGTKFFKEAIKMMIYQSRCVYNINFNVRERNHRIHMILDANTLDVLIFEDISMTTHHPHPEQSKAGNTSSSRDSKYWHDIKNNG